MDARASLRAHAPAPHAAATAFDTSTPMPRATWKPVRSRPFARPSRCSFALCGNLAQACVIHPPGVLKSYLPALVFLLLGLGIGTVFTLANDLLGPKRARPVKTEP